MGLFKICFFSFLLSFSAGMAYASPDGVAKVIIMRGVVKSKIKGKMVNVKKGMWIPEGAIIATSAKSFAKMLFIDKSSMNLGPNSQMKISTFPKKEAGIITLMKGQLRSKVTKNFMEMGDKNKSKLFIKTKTAAMGVRGTDFQVNFNPNNGATALVTFHGAVAMAKLEGMARNLSQASLERAVSAPTAVIVRKGQFSGVNKAVTRVTIPTKISPTQLETMEKNDTPGFKGDENKAQAKMEAPKQKFRSIVPPGANSKSFANDDKAVEKAVAVVAGAGAVKKVEVQIKDQNGVIKDAPPPEGFYNKATGEFAPKAGGYIDMQTALYVAPPAGSAFDANTETFTPPENSGGIDPSTGDYVNKYYTLTDNGDWEKKEPEVVVTTDEPKDDGRGPASDDDADKPDDGSPTEPSGDPDAPTNPDDPTNPDEPLPPPPESPLLPPPEFDSPELDPTDPSSPTDSTVCIECTQETILQTTQDGLNLIDQNARTNTNFNFQTQ